MSEGSRGAGFARTELMRLLVFLALVGAVVFGGGYYALTAVGLIGAECPAVSRSANQIVIENRLPIPLRVRLHDATTEDIRVEAQQCILVDINRLKISVETWELDSGAIPNCVASLLPAQRLSLYERSGLVYCDVGRAELTG